MKNRYLIPIVIVLTFFATAYLIYSVQKGRVVSLELLKSRADEAKDPTSIGVGKTSDLGGGKSVGDGFLPWVSSGFTFPYVESTIKFDFP